MTSQINAELGILFIGIAIGFALGVTFGLVVSVMPKAKPYEPDWYKKAKAQRENSK